MLRPREENDEYRRSNGDDREAKKTHIKRRKRMREIRTKGIVFAALALWTVAALNLCISTWRGYRQKVDVVDAFSEVVYSDVTADITANGYFGDMALTENAKYIILEEIAEKIGINRYIIQSNGEGSTVLEQNSPNGNVLLKMVTVNENADTEIVAQNQYLCMNIQLKNSIASTDTYRKLMKQIVGNYHLDTIVTVDLSGKTAGRMSEISMKDFRDSIMREIGGVVRTEKMTEDLYTVYGYDKDIDTAISIGKEKVNINITMSYDENKDQTLIHLSTPINNRDY